MKDLLALEIYQALILTAILWKLADIELYVETIKEFMKWKR